MIHSLVMKSNIILWFPSRWVLINAKFRGTYFSDLLRVVNLKKWVQSIICFEIWLFYLFMMFFLQKIAEIVPLRIWLCMNCSFWCLLFQFNFIILSYTSVFISWTKIFLSFKGLVPIAYTPIDRHGFHFEFINSLSIPRIAVNMHNL